MANEERCVFCGQTVSTFRSTNVLCGDLYQYSCKACAREMNELDHAQRCQRALLRGLADRPERLREYLKVHTEAEDHRLTCPCCGGKLRFRGEFSLDTSPYRDSIFASCLEAVLTECPDCGRYDFFNPETLKKDPYLKHLLLKDTTNT